MRYFDDKKTLKHLHNDNIFRGRVRWKILLFCFRGIWNVQFCSLKKKVWEENENNMTINFVLFSLLFFWGQVNGLLMALLLLETMSFHKFRITDSSLVKQIKLLWFNLQALSFFLCFVLRGWDEELFALLSFNLFEEGKKEFVAPEKKL